MTFVLTGLDVRDTEIVLVGGGDVTARRAATLHAHGAVLRIIAPQLSVRTADFIRAAAEDSASSAAADTTAPEWVARRVRLADMDGAWMVHTATGDPAVDTMVAEECRARRIWCINASDAAEGSARMPAQARREGTVFGALSTGSPNPSRTAEVIRAVAEQVDQTTPAPVDTLAPAATRATGTVHLLGGGPGPTDLLTVRAHRILASADVIVHDRLGPTDLDGFCDANTEVIDVGKHPGRHPVPQEDINAIIVDRAARGLTVARLKGGDPFVFGRGGEEVIACRAAGVRVEVVPGISSAVAAPSCAGVPVTHRGVADAVHVVNGHREWDARTRAALLDDATTVVVLMGVSTLTDLVDTALADGVPASRPVAIVENAHRPGQRCVRATLGSVMTAAEVHGVRAPAVIVVGETARAGLLDAASPAPRTPVAQAVTA
ncbi:MAG TPA: uroporphyrinogen-III C-methyltransferase [Candidatus Corynebacterium avicola]|uniref:uroporphyrinogen-III C-methyltransferase n=1 Tax=Candidatus Corynebacterium avicola TaxID=2838527 RepID=A0A9D1UK89_9CORY|nr:uroporphyrinogen-III C-methyltransferase [Candidatus Corynebacterium avicola]